jgi:hypothetical protein
VATWFFSSGFSPGYYGNGEIDILQVPAGQNSITQHQERVFEKTKIKKGMEREREEEI